MKNDSYRRWALAATHSAHTHTNTYTPHSQKKYKNTNLKQKPTLKTLTDNDEQQKSPIEINEHVDQFPGSAVRKFLFQVQGVAGNPSVGAHFQGACLGPLQGTLGTESIPPPELFKSIRFLGGMGCQI